MHPPRCICLSSLFFWVLNRICSLLFHYTWIKHGKSYLQLSGISTHNAERGFSMSCELEQLESCVCVWVTGCVFPGCSRPVSLVSPRGIGTLQECKNVTPLGSACALVPDCYWQKQTVNDFERAERERKLSRLLGRLSGLSTLLHIYLDTLIATEHGGSKELHELGSASWGTIRFPRHIALETNGTLSGGDAKLAGGGEWNPAQMRGGIFLKLFLWDRSRSSALSLVSSCWCFVFWPRGFILL